MSANHQILHAAEKLVHALNKAVDDNLPKEIAEIVKNHSMGAAAAGVASGWIPGAGGLAAVGISAGFIWTMYGRINSKIGLPLTENIIKSLGTAIATNLASNFIAGLIFSTVFSILPGIGSVGAAAVVGGTCYALSLASGYVYLKVLTALFLSGNDPTTMDADSLKHAAARVAATEDMKTVIEDARASYKSGAK